MNARTLRPLPFWFLFCFAVPGKGEHSTAAGASWQGQLALTLVQTEYEYTKGAAADWSAPNRAQGLRSILSLTGLQVRPRAQLEATGLDGLWLGLSVRALGREEQLLASKALALCVQGDKVRREHQVLCEEIHNTPAGLKLAWELSEPLPGAGPILLQFAITGELRVSLDATGADARFLDATGQARLHLRSLQARDAVGNELAFKLLPGAGGVKLEIEDGQALYPISASGVLASSAWESGGEQAGAHFGIALAAAGDVNGDGYPDVLVGADRYDQGEEDEGLALLYFGSANGLETNAGWSFASDQAGARLGQSLRCAGDVNGDGFSDILLGAPQYSNTEQTEGRSYAFYGSAQGLAALPDWTKDGLEQSAQLGTCVAGAGDVNQDGYSDVLLAAPLANDIHSAAGRVYLYLGTSGGLPNDPAWIGAGEAPNARYGFSLAGCGDLNGDGFGDVLVGAPFASNGELQEGRAYAYYGSANGLAAAADWTAESEQEFAFFGLCVAPAGDVNGDGFNDVAIGAPTYSNGEHQEGRSYLYHGSAQGLEVAPAWTAEAEQVDAQFGLCLYSAGDFNGDGYGDLLVGAPGYDESLSDVGRASLYLGSATGLEFTPAWNAFGDEAGSEFGFSLSLVGDVTADGYGDVLVGAHGHDGASSDAGRVQLFPGNASGLAASPGWLYELDQNAAHLGCAVAAVGDVNGDGYGDVVAGARNYDNGEVDEGRALLFLGGPMGLANTPAWSAESNQVGALFGHAVAGAGDVNGDGFGDVLVGALRYTGGQVSEGSAYLYYGTSSGLSAEAAWRAEPDRAAAGFGGALASAGDVNGDGYGDVVIGALSYDDNLPDAGRAYVYHGSPAGLSQSADWTAGGEVGGAYFGWSVAEAGDVNGDGYSDVLIGARDSSHGELYEGRAYLYTGSAAGLATVPAWTAEADQAFASFGSQVASAGDVNADGFADVVIGASGFDNGELNEGRAFVYHGSGAGLAALPAWTYEANRPFAGLGSAVSGAGDSDGDGYSEVFLGAPYWSQGQSNEGATLHFHGSAVGLANAPSWISEGEQANAAYGSALSSHGDFNGDGYAELLVGAQLYGLLEPEEGRLFAYYGNAGHGGLILALQQQSADDTQGLARLGGVGPTLAFRLHCSIPRRGNALGWFAPQLPEAWLEWELKPYTEGFDGQGLERGLAYALLPGGGLLPFDELLQSSVSAPLLPLRQLAYRWRVRMRSNHPLALQSAWSVLAGGSSTEWKLRQRGLLKH